eukprot:Lankesteria_metandrocarpae@DN3886_c0_g1_i1.p1
MDGVVVDGDRHPEIDDDDEVVEEMDVYLNRLEEGTSVYVLQYPLRPSYRPYGDQGQLSGVEFRRNQGTMRLSYDLNSRGSNFDSDKNMDGAIVDGRVDAEGGAIINHSLASGIVYDPNCTYAVGIRHEGNLYLTPVSKLLQFRPQFTHIDRAVEVSQKRASAHFARTSCDDSSTGGGTKPKGKSSDAGAGSDTSTVAGEVSEESMVQAQDSNLTPELWLAKANSLGVFFNGPGGEMREVTEGRQKIPFGKLTTLLEEEPWIAIETLYDAESTESFEILELLCSFEVKVPEGEEVEDASGDGDAALNAMGIATKRTRTGNNTAVAGTGNTAKAKVKYVSKRVTDGRYVPEVIFHPELEAYLDALCGTAAQRSSASIGSVSSGALSYQSLSRKPVEQQVLVILKHRHVLTFKTVKSLVTRKLKDDELVTLLRKFGTLVFGNWVCKSEYVYDGYEALCRDLLLMLLQMKQKATQRELFCNQTKLPMATVTEMLQQVAEFRGTAWHFKLPPDNEFVTNFPKERDAAREWWGDRMKVVRGEMSNHLKRQASALAAAKSGTSNFDRAKLVRVIEKCLKDCGAMLLKDIYRETEKRSKLVAGSPVGSFTESDLLQVLPDFAIDIRGVWALRQLGDKRIDAWRDVIITLFRTNTEPLSKDAIMREISTSVQQMEPIPDLVMRSLLREFAINKEGKWHFKQQPEESKT